MIRNVDLLFEGTEAFRCTYYRSRGDDMREAYDRLVDRGNTDWLREIRNNLSLHRGDSSGLSHMMINFDDGPCYEVICRAFRVETTSSPLPQLQ